MTETPATSQRTALVTGSAGFIGYHTCRALLKQGWTVIGLDGMTDYYDVTLKQHRVKMLQDYPAFTHVDGLLQTPGLMMELFETHRPDAVIHLAAQAGVRYSIEAPRSYLDSNLIGVFELLEAARAFPPQHLLMASTSSIYGANTDMPYAENAKADLQMSFYAATKKANEAMAHSYAHLYGIPVSMFRFFTVYGPWGRPDMALFKFTKAILAGDSIDVYNQGKMQRDFTYIDDLVTGIVDLIEAVPGTKTVAETDSLSPVAPFRAINLGNAQPVQLMTFIEAIEDALQMKAKMNLMPIQPGDVPATWADTGLITALTGGVPHTDIKEGVARFVDWYRGFYKV